MQVEGNEGSSARLLKADGSERSANRLKHEGRINSAEFSHDGRRIATTSEDKTARIWDAESGKADGTALIHPAAVEFARFSPDDRKLITACADGLARVWDVQSHAEIIPSLRHNAAVSFADFSPDGRHLVTASKDKTTRVWNAETGSPEAKPIVHEHEVVHAQFSPDARLLVTIAKHWFSPNVMAQVIRVWDAVSGDPVSDPIPLTDEGDDKSDGPAFAEFSNDGRWLLITAGTKRNWLIPKSIQPALPGGQLRRDRGWIETQQSRGDRDYRLQFLRSQDSGDGSRQVFQRWRGVTSYS